MMTKVKITQNDVTQTLLDMLIVQCQLIIAFILFIISSIYVNLSDGKSPRI